jgi:hypothetical protein
MTNVATGPGWELRCGRWETALADVEMVDAVITDPPYSERTHRGHDNGANMANRKGGWKRANGEMDEFRVRRDLSYSFLTPDDVAAFCDSWVPRCRGWVCAFSDSDLCAVWRRELERHGLTGFQPIPCVIPGMSVRMAGDGPSSWAVYLNVARPKALHKWGTLRGAYVGGQGEREHIGGKPEWLMREIIRDYTRRGDLVCDPCAGGATTLLAAAIEGRSAIGSEMDPETYAKAVKRLQAGFTPTLFSDPSPEMKQEGLKL